MSFVLKKSIFKYLILCFCLFLVAIAYNLFIVPINLVAGGPGGIGIIVEFLFGIDRSIVVFIVSLFMFLIAVIFLDKEQVIASLIVTIVFPLAIELTSSVSITVDDSHTLVMTLFGAIITGISNGMVLNIGLNSGGFAALCKMIYKYTKISIPFVNFILNGIVVVLGAYFIGVNMILYALIYLFVLKYVSERVMLGSSSNKTFKIISEKYEEIEKFIHDELFHDVTIYDTTGYYTGNKSKLIMVVVPTSEFITLKDYIKKIDKNAFIFVVNTYEVDKQDIAIRKEKE